ncbi:Sugar tr and/or MFS 1 domain containing protein [Asbolus verrucosus]|uniref:Sugar tr and/or MFS 1 domain containing protein n=1 Tax=Asbolus verrucosus TaxID=1661398 RepID=A0A482VQ62_ASBVE|nr:Sugar tr and/or MFS 1 domain containing protein [Asbolus verrucosus]
MVNREKEAEAALQKIRRGPIRKDLEEMKKNVEKSQGIQIKFIDLIKSKAITQGLFIGCGLMFLQQFSGITAIISYMQSIFDASESSLAPEISTIIIGVIQVAITLVTSQLVDRLGRRILLLTSLTGMLLSHTLMAFVLTVIFPNVTQIIGMACSFWLFAGFCMFGIVFVWRMVPETKGKSLRNIQNILEGNNEEEPKDSLIILTSCQIRALAIHIYITKLTNAKMTPQQIKELIEEFYEDPKNSDSGLTLMELIDKLKETDINEEWQEIMESVQNLYLN